MASTRSSSTPPPSPPPVFGFLGPYRVEPPSPTLYVHCPRSYGVYLREQLWLETPPLRNPRRHYNSFLPNPDPSRPACGCRIPALNPILCAPSEAPLRVVPKDDPDAVYEACVSLRCPHDKQNVVFSFSLAGTLNRTEFELDWDNGWHPRDSPMAFRIRISTVTIWKVVAEEECQEVVEKGDGGAVTVEDLVDAIFSIEEMYLERVMEE